MEKYIPPLQGPYNQYTYFIAANPPTPSLPYSTFPKIDKTAFIGPFSCVIGDVTIGENSWLACNVVAKADQGTPFYIGNNTNIQDGVIIHGWANCYVTVGGNKYSVYIGNEVSCAHNSVVHGPCFLGNRSLVGVNAIVFNAYVDENCLVGKGAVVTNGVYVRPNRCIPTGAIIDTQEKADALGCVTGQEEDKLRSVIELNEQFPCAYSKMFEPVCTCGMCCCKQTNTCGDYPATDNRR